MYSQKIKEHKTIWIAAVAASILIVIAAFVVFPSDQPAQDEHAVSETTHTDDAHGDEEIHADEARLVRLTSSELNEFGIEVQTAQPGALRVEKTFPGEVRVNQERYAHVVARVPGVAASVRASVGEQVSAGEIMAVLESRELAEATAAYLAARKRLELAEATFEREERLYEKKISSERAYLEARQALAETRIELQAARQALQALGFPDSYINKLPGAPDAALYQYPLTSPISGVVVERHLTRGEAVGADTEAFEVADLSNVWVDLSIYQDDMDLVREGQEVIISAGGHRAQGTISYVRPIVGENTRTSLARVVLPNPHGRWKPGMFVSGAISISSVEAPVVVPKTAVQTIDGRPVVFVKTADGFAPRTVTIGAKSGDHVAVTAGLSAGEEYAAGGTFTLKAQLSKGSFEAGHAH